MEQDKSLAGLYGFKSAARVCRRVLVAGPQVRISLSSNTAIYLTRVASSSGLDFSFSFSLAKLSEKMFSVWGIISPFFLRRFVCDTEFHNIVLVLYVLGCICIELWG